MEYSQEYYDPSLEDLSEDDLQEIKIVRREAFRELNDELLELMEDDFQSNFQQIIKCKAEMKEMHTHYFRVFLKLSQRFREKEKLKRTDLLKECNTLSKERSCTLNTFNSKIEWYKSKKFNLWKSSGNIMEKYRSNLKEILHNHLFRKRQYNELNIPHSKDGNVSVINNLLNSPPTDDKVCFQQSNADKQDPESGKNKGSLNINEQGVQNKLESSKEKLMSIEESQQGKKTSKEEESADAIREINVDLLSDAQCWTTDPCKRIMNSEENLPKYRNNKTSVEIKTNSTQDCKQLLDPKQFNELKLFTSQLVYLLKVLTVVHLAATLGLFENLLIKVINVMTNKIKDHQAISFKENLPKPNKGKNPKLKKEIKTKPKEAKINDKTNSTVIWPVSDSKTLVDESNPQKNNCERKNQLANETYQKVKQASRIIKWKWINISCDTLENHMHSVNHLLLNFRKRKKRVK